LNLHWSFYNWIAPFLEWEARSTRDTRRLRVRPKVAYAISREAVAMGDRPNELAAIAKSSLATPTLCLVIENVGREAVTVDEVGLSGWFDRPRLAMDEPLFHDAKGWPRRLAPGDSMVAYLTPAIQKHPVLSETRFGYAQSTAGEIWTGTSAAVPFFVASVKHPTLRKRLREA
jgi:hypothetical protein